MEFRLLGRVEAIGNSGPLELGRRRERGVLAILLLEVGQPVSVERLIELLFDDDPPRDPRKAIQIDISRLRRSLAEAADEDDVRLTSDQSGYALHTDPESVDVHRFTALVKTARTTDDPAERADLLRSALDLWRGQALADLAPGPRPSRSGSASRSCGWPRSSSGSKPTSCWAGTPSWFPNSPI